jgi:serine palmitoyltransferase
MRGRMRIIYELPLTLVNHCLCHSTQGANKASSKISPSKSDFENGAVKQGSKPSSSSSDNINFTYRGNPKKSELKRHEAPKIPLFTAMATYFGYGLLIAFGHMRDFFSGLSDLIFGSTKIRPPKGYAPIVSDFEDFYTRRLYGRIHDCWNRPIASCPGAYLEVIERTPLIYGQPLAITNETRTCLNLGSYNYLGFGDPDSPTKAAVMEALWRYSAATTSTRNDLGTTKIHAEAEQIVARFLNKEAAMVFGMGFGTNSTVIPALVGRGGLIISDATNHSSIAIGARASGATIKVFRHNDVAHLERVIRRAIVEGQPKSHRPWAKILIMIEGIYSMEGEMSPLKQIVELKKKYHCYLYVDEAHSIGAIGHSGRGITEHTGIGTADVDVMMGTFTKSFGAVGGYIAASKEVIDYLRYSCAGSAYSSSISPPACQQVVSAFKIIMGEDGTNIGRSKMDQLKANANYFRQRLIDMGCHVIGDFDSPIVPMMLYCPAKIAAFSRECYSRGLAVVVVGFPASPLLLSRTRFCISAAHSRKDLEIALEKIEEVCRRMGLKYAKALI